MLTLQQSQFLSEPSSSSQTPTWSVLSFEIQQDKKGTWATGISAFAQATLQEDQGPDVSVSDLFLSRKLGAKHFFLGRKRRPWSLSDEFFHIGLWQPMTRWDYFELRPQGLTGLFLGHQGADWFSEFFVSPVFLPDQGPAFEINQGQFASSNRWFWAPQSSVGILKDQSKIFYILDKPSWDEVVFQFSAAGRWLWEPSRVHGFWGQVALADKPVNQFHLRVDGRLDLKDQEVKVRVKPLIVRHTLATGEMGWRSMDQQISLAVHRDHPRVSKKGPLEIDSELVPSWFAVLMGSQRLGFLGAPRTTLDGGYLKRFRDDIVANSLVSSKVESSYGRFDFEDLLHVGMSQNVSVSRIREWVVALRWWIAPEQRGSWLSASSSWKWTSDLHSQIKFDVLGTELSRDDSAQFISRYRNNDRVMVGMTYVF